MATSTRATPGTAVSRHRMMTRSSLSTASPSAAICASAHGSQPATAASAPTKGLGSYRGTAIGLVSARVLDAGARFSTPACVRNSPMALQATREQRRVGHRGVGGGGERRVVGVAHHAARVGAAARRIRLRRSGHRHFVRAVRVRDDLPGARVDVSVQGVHPRARGVLALAQARGELVVRGIRLRQRGFLLRDRSLQLRLARVLRLSLLVVLRDLTERLQLRARVRERLPAPALRRDRRGSLQATRDVAQDHVQGLARGRLFVLPEDGQGVRGEPRVHEHGRGGGGGGGRGSSPPQPSRRFAGRSVGIRARVSRPVE